MRICVTGGMGYIGSELSLALHKAGHEVTVYDWKLKPPHNDLFYAKDFNYDIVYHLAAIAGNVACDRLPLHFVKYTNVEACKWIERICNKDTLIVYASTSAIYGEPRGQYAETKLTGEHMIQKHTKSLCLRLPTIYGVSHFMRPNILVNDLVKSAVREGYIVLRNKGDIRPYMSIEDCVKILMLFSKYDTRAVHGEMLDAYSTPHFATKDKVAFLIKSITDCEVFYSKEKDKYPQDFFKFPDDYDGWFRFASPISKQTLYPLVEYYDR